jgi:tetratricopeptide (TPR) repeat protein
MIPDCTLVTACFDLTKYNSYSRDLSESINKMSSLLEVPCYLIIFTDAKMYEVIKNKREEFKLEKLTHYIVTEVENLENFKYTEIVKKNREKYHPTKDERTCPESHIICCSKFELVIKAINLNPFNTKKFGWIDANIGVNFSKISTNYKNNMLLNILNNCSENKFHLQILNVCNKDLIKEDNLREYYKQYRWIVCGCLFISGKELGIKILTELNNIFIKHTLLGYGHGEEMFYQEILDKYYNEIERSYGDYQHILNNFININVGLEYILNISSSYLALKYHKECIDCCSKVIKRYENYEIEMNYGLYFKFLFNLYISLYYFDKNKSKELVIKIKNLIEINPYIRNEYSLQKDFYESQFKYALF